MPIDASPRPRARSSRRCATIARTGLSQWDVLAIAGKARLDPRSVMQVLEGHQTLASTEQRVIDAALALGVSLDKTRLGKPDTSSRSAVG